MKKYKTLLIIFCGTLVIMSCKKNDYLTDGGVHEARTELNTYDYLKSNQYHLFDTFLLIIDKFNLKTELLNSKTVFAVTDYSIKRYMDLRQAALQLIDINKVFTLDSLYKNMTADSVRQYFFDVVIELENAVIEPEVRQLTSRGNTTCGFSKRAWSVLELNGNDAGLFTWTNTPAYGLYYTRIRGALDVPGVTPPPNEIDIKVLCQTTGILPRSDKGTYDQVLHVLSNQHTFIRF
ncbi:MAG TPA: hypothetical protein VGQ09_23235 [Chitinophagaceae bacterium]|jgi:hypothetical protein|nr:hypothetical protein [Chitinophagaceae bacterium]